MLGARLESQREGNSYGCKIAFMSFLTDVVSTNLSLFLIWRVSIMNFISTIMNQIF